MRLRRGAGLAAFCLLAGSNWLVDTVWPTTIPPLLAQSTHLAVLGSFALILCLARPSRKPSDALGTLQVAGTSLLLFSAPAILGRVASTVRPETSVALYALAPLCIVGVVTFANEAARSLMIPALVGAAGAWLILPWQLPLTARGATSFAAVLLSVPVAAVASVWMHRFLQGTQLRRMLAAVGFMNMAVLAAAGLLQGERAPGLTNLGLDLLRGLLIDVPQVCVFLWLLRDVAPERVGSRFFLVPLVTLVEGLLVLHVHLDLRTALGLLLLLFGAGALLFARQETAPRLDLR